MKILRHTGAFLLIAAAIFSGCRQANADEGRTKDNIQLEDLEVVVSPEGLPSVTKQYVGFTVNFNPENKTPNYVAWILQGNETDGVSSRTNRFWTDEEIEGCPTTRDYTRSGYDRGHMCPAGEQKWSEEAMHNSFVMSNICPQKHEFNSGAWKTLEEKERVWARRDSALVIIAGPIYTDEDRQTIGKNEVRVPSAFFKVLLAPYSEPMRAIGFVYPNMQCPGNMANYATTVDKIEKITGMDFFSALPDDLEDTMEASVSFRDWNNRKSKE